jgi:hypothetical protein
MALPTGTISMSQVNTELGKSSTAQISLNDADVRSLAGVPSGAISMDDLRGQSAYTPISNVSISPISWNQYYASYDQYKAFTVSYDGGDGTETFTWSVSGTGLSISSGGGSGDTSCTIRADMPGTRIGSVSVVVNDGTSSDSDSSSIYVSSTAPM